MSNEAQPANLSSRLRPGDGGFQVEGADMSNTPRIRCAQCNKLVDRVFWQDDYDKRGLFIEVECHGQKESMTLTYNMFADNHRALKDQEGVAFTTAALTITEASP